MLLPLIILVILGCVYAGSLKSPGNRLCVVICVMLIILVLCYFQMHGGRDNFVGGYAPLNYTYKVNDYGSCSGKNYVDASNYAVINNKLGSTATYDGLILNTPKNNNQLSKPVMFSPVGDGYILDDAMNSENFPTVDGKDGSPRSMFILKNNVSSPDCCPSTYSDSMGCICTTNEQREMVNRRGRNRNYPQYPDM